MTSLWRVYLTVTTIAFLAMAMPVTSATLQQSGGTCIFDCDEPQAPIGLPTPSFNTAPVNPLRSQAVDELLPGMEGDRFDTQIAPSPSLPPAIIFAPEDTEKAKSTTPWNYLPGLAQ